VRRIELQGMVGMDACRARQNRRPRGRQRPSLVRTVDVRAGDDLAPNTRVLRALDNRVAILRKAVVREVRTNID
jgi:hypothetical protein